MRRLCSGILPFQHRAASRISTLSPGVERASAPLRRRAVVPPVASQLRASSSVARAVANLDEENDEDDFMQAYEDMLLNASSQSDNAAASQGESTSDLKDGEVMYATPQQRGSADRVWTSPADVLVEEAFAILPADGSSMQLTDLTPLLDVEDISEYFGSVLSFFKLYPHRFTCAQEPKTRRWRVSRVARAPSTSGPTGQKTTPHTTEEKEVKEATSHADLDVSEMTLEEELVRLRASFSSHSASSTASDHIQPSPAKGTRLNNSQDALSMKRRASASAGVSSSCVTSDVSSNSAVNVQWSTIASLLPEDGSPVAIAQLRVLLPPNVAEVLRAHNTGLARHFKQDYDAARCFVALTADSLSMMRASASASLSPMASGTGSAPSHVPPLWTPPASPAVIIQHVGGSSRSSPDYFPGDGVYIPAPADYISDYPSEEAESWWADLPLDDAEDDGGFTDDGNIVVHDEEGKEEAVVAGDDSQNILDAATGLEEVPYDGLERPRSSGATIGDASLLAGLDVNVLRQAPSVPPQPTPKKPKLPASLASAGAEGNSGVPAPKRTRVPRPSTPEEWIALHTALANAHGWLTPSEMLDYLMECVPTFFVPLDEVRVSDALLKLIGPRTSMRTLLCRIYMYYVDKSVDGTQVRLAASVTHPQRGAADTHYSAWNPSGDWRVTATSAEWHRDQAAVAKKTTSSMAAPLRSGTQLTGSDATKAFPVMHVRRPIKSALTSVLPRRRRASESPSTFPATMAHAADPARKGTPSTSAIATTRGEGDATNASTIRPLAVLAQSSKGGVPLASIPLTDVGYPYLALATQPVEQWPWWARLLCVLPFDAYVPLEELSTRHTLVLTREELELVWKSSESVTDAHAGKGKPSHPFPFALLRPPPGGIRQVRLRPFWLSPGCTAELDAAVLPADLAKQLRPVWMAVPRVLKKLAAESHDAVLSSALRRMPGANCSAEEALLSLLRDCGRCCWVNQEGTKARRYTASHEMDDIFHFGLSFLHGFSSARTWEPVGAVLARAADHVRPVFKDQPAAPADSPYKLGYIGMLHCTPLTELHAFLKRHAQWIDVKVSSATEGDAAPELLIRRRAAFVSFEKDKGSEAQTAEGLTR
ncbi:hypothetical protein ABL78_4092 [Leptomonas seymouri]|uniref:Uncharacterized protein n=1 Tax=Leptomonas seymouri TaxID=5684 RepID=A0A0N0P5U0_LEPSE|nr:hypothetical protein ABL78_4092 [Leptomonas seymouri]|eukprot:KPI86856.1 hypothetical protein ABL78_4092 [Leptomonas seymouri]